MYEMEGPRSAMQPSVPIARLAGHPAAVRCRPHHQRQLPAWNSGYPAFPAFLGCIPEAPGVSPEGPGLLPDLPGVAPGSPGVSPGPASA
jgi:hypothetical protein